MRVCLDCHAPITWGDLCPDCLREREEKGT